MKWNPRYEDITIEPEPQASRRVFGAVTNFPDEGTKVRCELQGWVVEGVVRYANPEYGSMVIEKDIWIDRHHRGTIVIRVAPKTGWTVEVVDEASSDAGAE